MKKNTFNLIVQYLEKYSSTAQQLASRGWHRVDNWRREEGWEMAELKDRHQKGTKEKLQFHSLLTLMPWLWSLAGVDSIYPLK